MTEKMLADINHASLETLIAVPGIGPALAKRIIEHRPYQDIDQLTIVSGIGESSLEALKPYLTIEQPLNAAEIVNIFIDPENQIPAEDTPIETVESEILRDQESDVEAMVTEYETNGSRSSEFEPENLNSFDEGFEPESDVPAFQEVDVLEEIEPVPDESHSQLEPEILNEEIEQDTTKEKVEEKKEQDWVTRSQLTWSVIAAVVGSVLLTVALTLGIMAFINGDLRYATWNDALHLSNQITVLTERNNDLQSELDNMRKRVDALETIAGRVSVLEETTQTLQEDLSETQDQVSNLEESIAAVQEDIQLLQGKVSEFNHAFLGIYQAISPVVEPMLEGGEN